MHIFLVSFSTGAATRFAAKMKNFPFNPFFSPEASQFEEDISPESFAEFLTDMLRRQRDPSNAGLDHESFLDPPRWEAPLKEPECAYCRSKTENLKRCSGCKRVFYCSKTLALFLESKLFSEFLKIFSSVEVYTC